MTKFSFELKLKIVEQYLSGTSSTALAKRYGVKNSSNITTWVARYRKYGINGLKIRLVLCQESGQFKLRLQTMLRPVRNDSHSKAVQKPLGSYNHSDYESVLYCSKHQYIRSKDDVLHECL